MQVVPLTAVDLSLAAGLVVALSLMSIRMTLGIAGRLLVAGCRTTVQLLLIGLVLRTFFAHVKLGWITLMALVMLGVAGREVMQRQRRRFSGWFGFGAGTLSMSVSSFSITVLALTVIIDIRPGTNPNMPYRYSG